MNNLSIGDFVKLISFIRICFDSHIILSSLIKKHPNIVSGIIVELMALIIIYKAIKNKFDSLNEK